jgi:hypothetical protein
MLAIAQSAVALCAVWQATPESRLQRCHDTVCPLHHHEQGGSGTQYPQTQVDNCCAESQQRESSPSRPAFAGTITHAVLESLPPVVLRLPPAMDLSAPWETPSPPPHVPKHLLLSVLLV